MVWSAVDGANDPSPILSLMWLKRCLKMLNRLTELRDGFQPFPPLGIYHSINSDITLCLNILAH